MPQLMNKNIAVGVLLVLQAARVMSATSVDEVIAEFDRNKNGSLEATELAEYLKAGEDKEFDRRDLNQNGTISKEEWDTSRQKKAESDALSYGRNTPDGPLMEQGAVREYLLDNDREFKEESEADWVSRNLPGLRIRQSMSSPQQQDLPARLSFTWDGEKSDSFYSFDGAIGYSYDAFDDWAVGGFFEAHTTDASGPSSRDTLSARLLIESYTENYFFQFTPKYDFDSKAETSAIGADLVFSPSPSSIPGLGSSIQLVRGINWRWRPLGLVEFGHIIDDGGIRNLAAEDNYLRVGGRFETSFWFGESLNTVLTGAYVGLAEMTGLEESYHYLEVNLVHYMDRLKRLSLGLTYRNGEQTPKFIQEDSLLLWVGLKF
jgi:hypothetical protein